MDVIDVFKVRQSSLIVIDLIHSLEFESEANQLFACFNHYLQALMSRIISSVDSEVFHPLKH
jgi:hypothetical protein